MQFMKSEEIQGSSLGGVGSARGQEICSFIVKNPEAEIAGNTIRECWDFNTLARQLCSASYSRCPASLGHAGVTLCKIYEEGAHFEFRLAFQGKV